jgi:hypothetical protein
VRAVPYRAWITESADLVQFNSVWRWVAALGPEAERLMDRLLCEKEEVCLVAKSLK